MRHDLASFQSAESEAWLDAQRADAIRSVVEDVLADADARASLLQGGSTAGWDDGFYFRSADGNFSLEVGGNIQVRAGWNHRDNSGGDNDTYGFEHPRTQLVFSGNIVSPNVVYHIRSDFRAGGGLTLLDAYIGYAVPDTNVTLLAGQVKVPFLREWNTSDVQLLAVERSLLNFEFNGGRTEGVALDYRDDQFHLTAALTDGAGGANSPILAPDTEISVTGRAEMLLSGSWSQFSDMNSFRGAEQAIMIGGGAHYQTTESGIGAAKLDVFQWTLDASADFDGWAVSGAVIGRHLDQAINADQYALLVQASAFVSDDWEVFGRFEWADDDFAGTSDLAIVTLGATRYWDGHDLKWTTDVGFGLNPVASTWGSGLIGPGGGAATWRTDAAGEDGQVVIRSQLQLVF